MIGTSAVDTVQVAGSVETVACSLLALLESAWNRGDGEAFGAAYTENAAFVTIRGEYLRGRAQIAAGHAGIFATIYAGSVNRMDLIAARALGNDVILATSQSTLTAPRGPLQGVHAAMSTTVLTRVDDEWLITATHNTLVGER